MDTGTGALDGRTALVTGGSRGIGAAIAARLAAEGCAVALTYSASPSAPGRWPAASRRRAARRWPCAPTRPTPGR